MTAIGAGQREFAQLVANHVLGNQHGYMLLAVIHGNGQTEHLRQNHRTARPCLDRTLVVLGYRSFHFLRQVVVDERAFSDGTWHDSYP